MFLGTGEVGTAASGGMGTRTGETGALVGRGVVAGLEMC